MGGERVPTAWQTVARGSAIVRGGEDGFAACIGSGENRPGSGAWPSGMGGSRPEKAKHGRGLEPPAVSEAGLDPGYWLSASTALAGPRLSWPPVVDSTSAM